MGCSCTKGGEASDNGRTIISSKRPEDKYKCIESTTSGGGNNGGESVTDGDTSRQQVKPKKGFFVKIGNIIRPGGKKGKNTEGHAKDPNATGAEPDTTADLTTIQNHPGPSDTSKVAEHPYSLSKFSQKTVGLLNGFDEPVNAATRHESHAPADMDMSSKSSDLGPMSLREIKLYVSTPQHSSTASSTNAAALVSLVDMRNNAFLSATSSSSSSSTHDKTMSVFSHLRVHAAKQANNFDLNVIDLNQSSRIDASPSALLTNKYFKRKLNQIVLSDTLNLIKFRSSLNNYSPSQYLFVVYLTDTILDESDTSLLCPDSIDLDDYKRFIEKTLGKEDMSLFNRLYKKETKSDDKQKYKLVVDFFNSDSANSLANVNDDLTSMLGVFKSRFADSDEEGRAFKLKYLKSIQQEEIELAIQNVQDSSIVWFHLTSSLTNAFTSAESASSSASGLTFNQLRYKTILNSLQSKVLAHNYKHISVDESCPKSQMSEHEKTMNEFIFSSVKAQLDAYMNEYNSVQSKTLALKIDKQLAEEIHAHYELYKNLSKYETKFNQENRHKQQSFESKLANYLGKETRHPLVLYSAASEHSKDYSDKSFIYELNTDELIAKWMRKNRAGHRFIIYRFCGHTIISSQLTTVIQSMMHQLSYLLEIHESWAFDSCLRLVDRMCAALEYHKKEKLVQRDIFLVMDRVDKLVESEADQQLLLAVIRRLYSSPYSGMIKLVLTFKKTTLMSQSLTHLIDSIQNVFDSSAGTPLATHDKFCFNINSKKASLVSNASVGGVHSPLSSESELFVKQNLKLLFDGLKNSDPTLKFVSSHLIDSLFHLLSSSRYGLKQSELLDILHSYVLSTTASSSSSSSSAASQVASQLNHLISVVWFTFKYYLRLSKPAKSNALIETMIDNNQILYRLARSAHPHLSLSASNNNISEKQQLGAKLLSHVWSYYQSAFESPSSFSPALQKSTAQSPVLISQFHLRAFQELPQYYKYIGSGSGADDPAKLQQTFANSFIFNPKWLLNKSLHSHSIFGYQQDIDMYRRLFTLDEGGFLKQQTDVDLEHEKNEFRVFESFFFKFLYALQQDPNQILVQLRTNFRLATNNHSLSSSSSSSMSPAQAFVDKLLHSFRNELAANEKKKSLLPHLIPLNYEQLVRLNDHGAEPIETHSAVAGGHHHRLSRRETIAFNTSQDELTHFAQVYFITTNTIATLSENHKEIRIWSVESSAATAAAVVDAAAAAVATSKKDNGALDSAPVRMIRLMKLPRPPKDLRLLNKHTAVVLLNRNLHIFDLNKCEHLHDLQITMSTNVPYFEIHDNQHIVLLARNRLNIILMKVAISASSNSDGTATGAVAATTTTAEKTSDENAPQATAASIGRPTGPSGDDDMFVFKVGEDRFLNSLLVSKNGEVMVCGDEVQKPFPLLVWDLNQRKLVYDLRQAKHEFNTSIQSIGTSGRYVVCACQEEGESKNCLIVYDLSTGQLHKKLRAKLNVVCVEISEESGVIISCLENGQLIVYELANGSKRFTINSNRYPVNRIRILDSNKNYKNYFLTYDTHGLDWTIRLWDLVKGDELISSYTCPSRIVACSVNLAPLYFGEKHKNDDDLLIAVSLFGYKQPLVLKLATLSSINLKLTSPHLVDGVHANAHEPFSTDPRYDGIENELHLK